MEEYEMMKAWVKRSLPLVEPSCSASNSNTVESDKVMNKDHSSKRDKVKTKRIKVPKEIEHGYPIEKPTRFESTRKEPHQTKMDIIKPPKKEHKAKKDKTKKKKVKATGCGVWEEVTEEAGSTQSINNPTVLDVKDLIKQMEDLDGEDLGEYYSDEEEEEEWKKEYDEKRKEKRRKKREETYLNQQFVHLGQNSVVVPTTDDPTLSDRNMERDRVMKKLFGSKADHILAMETKINCGYQTAIDQHQPAYWPIIPLNFKV